MNKWIKGLPPIYKNDQLYLFKYRTFYKFNHTKDLGWNDEYFLASSTDPKLEDFNINNIWYFDFISNIN